MSTALANREQNVRHFVQRLVANGTVQLRYREYFKKFLACKPTHRQFASNYQSAVATTICRSSVTTSLKVLSLIFGLQIFWETEVTGFLWSLNTSRPSRCVQRLNISIHLWYIGFVVFWVQYSLVMEYLSTEQVTSIILRGTLELRVPTYPLLYY